MSANSPNGRYSGRLLKSRYQLSTLLQREPLQEKYRALDQRSNEEVLVTILLPPLDGDDVAMGLVAADVATVMGCRHPNLANLLDGFNRQDQRRPGELAFVVSEQSGGEHLSALVEKTGELEAEEAVTLVVSLLEGLEALHQTGCVHGGVRPAAVFIPDGQGSPWHRPLLQDPSIFLYLFPSIFMALDASNPAPGGLAEMLLFAPPEQLMGDDPDPRMDVYSAGAVLFHALAGKPPITAGDELSMTDLRDHLIHQNPALLFEHRSDLSDELAQAVSAAISRDPADRPRSAMELREALLPWYREPTVEEAPRHEPPEEAPARAQPLHPLPPPAILLPRPFTPPAQVAPLAPVRPAARFPQQDPPRKTVAMSLEQLEAGSVPEDDHPTIKMALPPVESAEEDEAPPEQEAPSQDSTYILPLDDLLAENEEEQPPAEPRVEDKSQQTIALSLDDLMAMEEGGEPGKDR